MLPRWYHDDTTDTCRHTKLQQDADYGASIGVTGTASFFVGRLDGDKRVDITALVGAQPFE